jgi:hypothetical protein
MNDFFSGIKQATLPVGAARALVPLFYRDMAYLGIYLLAPLDKVRNLLPSSRMHPYRLTPWHCIVTITASQYRESDIGPYNAVSVGVPFTLDSKTPVLTGSLRRPPAVPMIYLLHLPVTTDLARATGEAFAQYPEFLAEIGFTDGDDWVDCQARAGGKSILRLSGRKVAVHPFPRQRVCPVTLAGDRLLRSELNCSAGACGSSRKRSDVRLEFGDHPVAKKLQELKLGRVLEYQYYPAGQALLSAACESYPIHVQE